MTDNPYEDIIRLPRPEMRHPRMPMEKRAAQFAPFAALTGYEDAIENAGDEFISAYEKEFEELSHEEYTE